MQVPPPAAPAEVTSAATGVNMQPEYAKADGRTAYIWSWLMMNQLNRSAAMTLAPEPERSTEEEMNAFAEGRLL